MRFLWIGFCSLLSLSSVRACQKSSGPSPDNPSGCSSSSGTGKATPSASAAYPAPPRLPYNFEPGCAEDIDAKQPPAAQLDAIGRTCAPGMKAIGGAPKDLRIGSKSTKLTSADLKTNDCVRIGLAAARPDAVVEVSLVGPNGKVVQKQGPSRVPMTVAPAGPVCVGEEGTYEVRVRAMGPPVDVRVGLWRAERAAAAPSGS